MKKQICLNASVLELLDSNLTPDAVVLEFGAGWSTPWFARRCHRLVSVETDRAWTHRIAAELKATGLSNWSIAQCTTNKINFTTQVLQTLLRVPPADVVLVDCREDLRMQAAHIGWEHLAPDGVLVFDDAQRERHKATVDWLRKVAHRAVELVWAPGDIESARERLAVAFYKKP